VWWWPRGTITMFRLYRKDEGFQAWLPRLDVVLDRNKFAPSVGPKLSLLVAGSLSTGLVVLSPAELRVELELCRLAGSADTLWLWFSLAISAVKYLMRSSESRMDLSTCARVVSFWTWVRNNSLAFLIRSSLSNLACKSAIRAGRSCDWNKHTLTRWRG
jgi:hypothetical protein